MRHKLTFQIHSLGTLLGVGKKKKKKKREREREKERPTGGEEKKANDK